MLDPQDFTGLPRKVRRTSLDLILGIDVTGGEWVRQCKSDGALDIDLGTWQ